MLDTRSDNYLFYFVLITMILNFPHPPFQGSSSSPATSQEEEGFTPHSTAAYGRIAPNMELAPESKAQKMGMSWGEYKKKNSNENEDENNSPNAGANGMNTSNDGEWNRDWKAFSNEGIPCSSDPNEVAIRRAREVRAPTGFVDDRDVPKFKLKSNYASVNTFAEAKSNGTSEEVRIECLVVEKGKWSVGGGEGGMFNG
jgi:hypothetical protein